MSCGEPANGDKAAFALQVLVSEGPAACPTEPGR